MSIIDPIDYNKEFDLESIYYFCEYDLIWKTEEWKDIPNYIGVYQVSDLGRVKSLSRVVKHGRGFRTSNELILKPIFGGRECFVVNLSVDGNVKKHTIHQLVAIVFFNHIPCGYELVINHKNFIPTDNRKGNLEIVTSRENTNRKHLKSSSEYIGVGYHKKNEKWISRIVINGKRVYLGSYNTELEAYQYYEKKLKEITNKNLIHGNTIS